MNYTLKANILAERIFKLIPDNPHILDTDNVFDLQKIKEFQFNDLGSTTLFQLQWALARAKKLYNENSETGKMIETFSSKRKPAHTSYKGEFYKSNSVVAYWLTQPFKLDTQEGILTYSPDTCDDWDGGYYAVYPSDGSKPYGMSKSYFISNYTEFNPEKS